MKKVTYLDGLRGICAYIVVLHHFGNMFLPAISNGTNAKVHHPFELLIHNSLLATLFDGNLAVCFFFIIGGFTLTYKFFLKSQTTNTLVAIIKRYIRLGIPVLSAVSIAYLLMKTNLLFHKEIMKDTQSYWAMSFWQFNPSLYTMLKQTFINTFFGGDNNYLIILWTIKIEFLSSVAIYILVPFVRNRYIRFTVYIIAALLTYQSYYIAFLFGVILCDIYANNKERVGDDKNIIKNLICFILVGLGVLAGGTTILFPYTHGTNLKNIIAATLVVGGVLYSMPIKKLLETKFIQFLGKISFSVYLIHLFILATLSSLLFKFLIQFMDYLSAVGIVFMLSSIVISLAAYLFTVTVDAAAVSIASRIAKKIEKST